MSVRYFSSQGSPSVIEESEEEDVIEIRDETYLGMD
jgi:hypothetical protein